MKRARNPVGSGATRALLLMGLTYALVGSHIADVFFGAPLNFVDSFSALLLLSALSAVLALPILAACSLAQRWAAPGAAYRVAMAAILLLNALVLIRVYLAPQIESKLASAAATLAILLVVTVGLVFSGRRGVVLTRIAAVFVISALGTDVIQAVQYFTAAKKERGLKAPRAPVAADSSRPHVFHVLFDGMPGGEMLEVEEFGESAFFRTAPAGIYYPNTYAQADRTVFSVPQFLRGVFDYRQRHQVEALGKSFLKAGYDVKLYMDWYSFTCEDPTGRGRQKTHEMPYTDCFDKKRLSADESFGGGTVFQARRLFNAYLKRTRQNDWAARLFATAPTDQEDPLKKWSKGYVSGNYKSSTLALIDQFLEDIAHLDRPTYNFLHVKIPHPPVIYDKKCNVIGDPAAIAQVDSTAPRAKFIGQVFCANTVAKRILERLEALDLFEPSLVAIHGDHGNSGEDHYWTLPASSYRKRSREKTHQGELERLDRAIEDRAHTLLWLKPPHQRTREVRDHLALLLDLPVTVRAALDLPLLRHDGVDLLAHDAALYNNRVPYFYATRLGNRYFARTPDARWLLDSRANALALAQKRFRSNTSAVKR
jgi:hypothetical protein